MWCGFSTSASSYDNGFAMNTEMVSFAKFQSLLVIGTSCVFDHEQNVQIE